MSLGSSLFNARKKSGLSQEAVAEKLGVSRQTISKRELDETLPDIRQSKRLSTLYHMTLDELIDFDMGQREIEEIIANTSEEQESRIDWNRAWSKRHPILTAYRSMPGMAAYLRRSSALCRRAEAEFGLSWQDTILVIKDMVCRVYLENRPGKRPASNPALLRQN